MNKENRSAAGQRRSAIIERIRLREEWKELKGRESHLDMGQKNNILTKKQTNKVAVPKNVTNMDKNRKPSTRNTQHTDNILCGVVALVEVGSESRALPLRAALAALGASVLPTWNPLVTHLVWSQGGCRLIRARARALASRLVSPLWVEACASSARRLPEQAFPAAARPSDLPSPRTLHQLLKRAEMENIPLADLLSDSTEEQKRFRLRMSSETEQDTSVDTDTSKDISRDTSKDTSDDTRIGAKSQDKVQRPPIQPKPAPARRKIYTPREVVDSDTMDETDVNDDTPVTRIRKPSYCPREKQKTKQIPKMDTAARERKQLARAQRLAKKIVNECTPTKKNKHNTDTPRIVLTGMSRSERRLISAAVCALGGRLRLTVDKRTTHVLLGTCLHDDDYNRTIASGIPALASTGERSVLKQRTLHALCGAARGCRVLSAQWALDCKDQGRWLPHYGYEVAHLRKIAEKARLERSACVKLRSEYGYDVFCGMRVSIGNDVAQNKAAECLLKLCGAVLVQDKENYHNQRAQNGVPTQDGVLKASQYYVTARPQCEYDVRIGCDAGDVTCKWVFDSVAAGRMRNTRRYLVPDADTLSEQLEQLGC